MRSTLRPGGRAYESADPPPGRLGTAQHEGTPVSTVKIHRLATSSTSFEADFERLRHWSASTDAAIEARVAEIIADVRARGDAAVLELTARFDGVQAADMAALEIGQPELKAAFDAITPAQRSALQAAAERVRDFHERQLEASSRSRHYIDADGSRLGQ